MEPSQTWKPVFHVGWLLPNWATSSMETSEKSLLGRIYESTEHDNREWDYAFIHTVVYLAETAEPFMSLLQLCGFFF